MLHFSNFAVSEKRTAFVSVVARCVIFVFMEAIGSDG